MRALFVLLMLAACGTVPRDGWIHPTKSADDLAKDRYECDLVASREQSPVYRADLTRSCMRAHGWREQ